MRIADGLREIKVPKGWAPFFIGKFNINGKIVIFIVIIHENVYKDLKVYKDLLADKGSTDVKKSEEILIDAPLEKIQVLSKIADEPIKTLAIHKAEIGEQTINFFIDQYNCWLLTGSTGVKIGSDFAEEYVFTPPLLAG